MIEPKSPGAGAFLLCLLIGVAVTSPAAATPPPVQDNRALTGVLRGFHSVNENLRAVLELSHTAHNAQESESHLLAGPRWRLLSWLNLGAYWEYSRGIRNDDDWIRGSNGSWFWQDSSDRSEHTGIGELTARTLIPFDFNGSTFAEMRVRWKTNFTEQKQTAVVRPGLFHTLTKHGAPKLTLSLTHELIFHHSDRGISGSWTWLGMLWHFSESFAAGPFLGMGKRWWSTSDAARKHGLPPYSIAQNNTLYGLQMNVYDF